MKPTNKKRIEELEKQLKKSRISNMLTSILVFFTLMLILFSHHLDGRVFDEIYDNMQTMADIISQQHTITESLLMDKCDLVEFVCTESGVDIVTKGEEVQKNTNDRELFL